MAVKKGGLGRGLESLFEDAARDVGGPVSTLPLREIEPDTDQPRKDFDEQALSELADSIARHGLLQPIAVRAAAGGAYKIIAGERRWRAARLAGLSEVPVVIKDVAEAGGYGVVFGSSLDAAAREELANRIKEEPRRFIAQEVIQFRDIDVVDPKTGEMSPRKCDLRAFVVTGKNTHVWYSGLTRYSSVPGQMIVNSSQGGGFKDTWVLAPESGVEHEYGAETQVVNLLNQSRRHSLSLVTASKADNLYWLGRYTERAFTTLNQFFPFYDRVMDTDVDAFRPFAHALDLPEDFEDFDGFVNSFLYDGSNPDSVRSAVTSAFNNAVILRPELSSRLLQYVELAMTNITDAAKYAADAEDIYKQRDITDDMLAFWGGIENSPVDPTLKAFIFIGKYLERIDLYTRFGLTMEDLEAPLKKLAAYSMTLDGMPLPSCFADGLSWLVGQLPSRGYQEVADLLKKYLDDYSGRVSALAIKDMGSLSSMNMDAKRP